MNMDKWKEELRNKKIVIWGASIGGAQACACLEKNGIQAEAYCDNSAIKWGTRHSGKNIISPNDLKNLGEGVDVIIIASYAYEVIYKQIRNMGLTCEIYIYLLYDPCHIKKACLYSEQEKNIIHLLYNKESYTDDLIELILEKGFLNYDGFDNVKEYLGYGGIDQYYYDDIAEKVTESRLTLLDIGSYTGDSVLQLMRIFKDRIKKVYAFEPNRESCDEIRSKRIDKLELYEFGLGRVNQYVNFSKKGPFFRVSTGKEGIPVQIVRLDDLNLSIEGKCLLKIDIEGSERDCLEGAEEFIKRYKPYIAICVYHKEKDIMEIPRYLKSLVGGYSFFLRGGMHTVCYAFPEKGENIG